MTRAEEIAREEYRKSRPGMAQGFVEFDPFLFAAMEIYAAERVEAERAACAKIARDEIYEPNYQGDWNAACDRIAAAIEARKGEDK